MLNNEFLETTAQSLLTVIYVDVHYCISRTLYTMFGFFFSFCLFFGYLDFKDPHNLNVDVLALLLNSKCFHVLVMVNPFSLN